MRHLFIINPAAGKKETTAQLEAKLATLSFPYEVQYTLEAGDAQRITEEAAAAGEPVRIYACGGDGTLNEVVNGAAGHPHVAITNVPKGTGNDFLKIFGSNYRELFYDLEALAQGPQKEFDLIDCNGKLGIDVVCSGVDARIAADVHRYKRWFFVSGIGAYILALLENVLFKSMTCPMKVKMGDIEWDGETTIVCVCNGQFYGGGFNPVPEAMPDDGILDMLLVPKVSLLTFARLVGKYAKGRYKELSQYIREHHGQTITFTSEQEMTTVVDGEVMRGKEFTVALSEKTVHFFYPAAASYRGDEGCRNETMEESAMCAGAAVGAGGLRR